MAAIKHFSKQDATLRTGTAGGTTAAEVTNYTVSWADLTGAGFANGDDVLVFIKASLGANDAANNAEATFGKGSTFAGRTVLQTHRTESGSATTSLGAREICFLDRLTLATNDNFYTSIRIIATSTPNIEDYCFWIIKLGDLAADDFRYAETAPSGDAPETATDGASVTLPAASGDDWLVLGQVHWLVDTITQNMFSQLSLGGNVRMRNANEGEDTAEQFSAPLVGYLPAAGASAVCKIQYEDGAAGTNDVTRTAIFALRLNAFLDHIGNYSSSNVAMGGVVDTYVQTNTVSLSLTATGSVAWFAQTIGDVAALAQEPYHRVQVGNVDIVSGLGRRGHHSYDPTSQSQITQFGTISMNSGTRVIDVDCAEDVSTTAYNFDEHTLVAFSMELAPPVLAMLDTSQSQTSDTAVVTQHNAVTATDSAQAQASDTAVVTQHNAVTATDSTQSQDSENVAVTYHPKPVFFSGASWSGIGRRGRVFDPRINTTPPPSLPAVSLTATDSAQSQASDTAAITQHNAVTATDSAQSQASDTAAITQHNAVTATDSAQAQASDTAVVTVAGAVTATDSAQSQASDTAVITQHNAVTATDSAQSQASDTAVVTQHNAVTATDSEQSQASDTAVVTQHNAVAATDSAQAQASDTAVVTSFVVSSFSGPIPLSIRRVRRLQRVLFDSSAPIQQGGVFSVSLTDSAQSQASDTAVVTQHYSVTATDSAQAQASDTAVVTVAGAVTATDSAQAQASDTAVVTQHYSVTATDSAQTQASDTAVVSIKFAVTAIDSAQTQASDTAVVTIAGAVTATDSAQSQASDTAAITQHNAVTATDSAQSQTSALASVTINTITPIDTRQIQYSDQIGVFEPIIVYLNNTTQMQFSFEPIPAAASPDSVIGGIIVSRHWTRISKNYYVESGED